MNEDHRAKMTGASTARQSMGEQSTAERSADRAAARPGPLRQIWLAVAGSFVLIVGSLFMLLVAVLTLFQCRRIYAEWIAAPMARIALSLSGVRMVIHGENACRERQTVFIANHTSTLDVFAIAAMALPNTRCFLSGFLRKILPLGLIGYLIGIFWTVPLRFPEKRRKIFQRADRVLRESGESVFLTPEGSRIRTGQIAHFNRGAFHLATSLNAPICPIFIDIPEDSDPGMGLYAEPGTMHVYFLPTIETDGWTIEHLDQNRDRVREVYVAFHEHVRDVEPGRGLAPLRAHDSEAT